MEPVTADQMGTVITLGAAAVGSLLVIIVNCITGSRCTKIRCCGFECDRQLPHTEREEPEREEPEREEPEPEPEPEPDQP